MLSLPITPFQPSAVATTLGSVKAALACLRRPYFHHWNAGQPIGCPLGGSRNCVRCQEWGVDLEISQACTWEITLHTNTTLLVPDDILTDILPFATDIAD